MNIGLYKRFQQYIKYMDYGVIPTSMLQTLPLRSVSGVYTHTHTHTHIHTTTVTSSHLLFLVNILSLWKAPHFHRHTRVPLILPPVQPRVCSVVEHKPPAFISLCSHHWPYVEIYKVDPNCLLLPACAHGPEKVCMC